MSRDDSPIEVFYEKIPGSKTHSPDGTWWGYNMTKIARLGDTVFMYVIHNDDDTTTPSQFTIYKKKGDGTWERGASLPTSRPGNILVDSKGALHAFVFEAANISVNDSLGRLKHYSFAKAGSGDIKHYKEELVVDQKENIENVNIRIGAAIGKDDTMMVAFGLTDVHLYPGHSQHVYYKRPEERDWKHDVAGINLGHDWYYPFALVELDSTFHLLPIQDDFAGPGEQNIYQKIMYLGKLGRSWKKELIVDHSNKDVAKSRRRLLEQSDLYKDSTGQIHFIYKEFLNRNDEFAASGFYHVLKKDEGWETTKIELDQDNIHWIRFAEANQSLYYVASSYDQFYIGKVGSGKLSLMDIPGDVKGIYPYISQPKTGTRSTEKFIDILLLAGDSTAYPEATNLYVRIPKEELARIE